MNYSNVSVPVAYLVAAVAQAVKNIGEDSKQELRVKSLSFTLEMTSERTESGELAFGILTIGGTYNRATTQTLSLSFDENLALTKGIADQPIDQNILYSLTTAIRVGIAEGRELLPGFSMTESSMEFQFGVQEDGNIALGMEGKEPAWSFEFKLAGSTKTTHSMKFTVIRATSGAGSTSS